MDESEETTEIQNRLEEGEGEVLEDCKEENKKTWIHHLPQEVLEHIFSMVSPYCDFKSVMLTCSWWHKIMILVLQRCYSLFHQSVRDGNIVWSNLEIDSNQNANNARSISERYSHCSSYLGCCMYVFGGCTSSNTTFNDLWRFDLATRKWIRPLAMGTYPSPKACATMVTYQESLILFGGYTHPTPYPLHQAARFFNQLHVYDPNSNRWSNVNTIGYSPPPIAGHSASIVGDRMIVFGGSHGQGSRTNDVWVLDLVEFTWTRRDIAGRQPNPRYGQTQTVLDDLHILVIGGCGGANMLFSDIWMLDMSDETSWRWIEMSVVNADPHAASQLWCHPACKVGDVVVVLSKSMALPRPLQNKPSPIRGTRLSRLQPTPSQPDPQSESPFRVPLHPQPESHPPQPHSSHSQPHTLQPSGQADQPTSALHPNPSPRPTSSNLWTPPREAYTNRAPPCTAPATQPNQRSRLSRFHSDDLNTAGSSSSDEGTSDSLPSTSSAMRNFRAPGPSGGESAAHGTSVSTLPGSSGCSPTAVPCLSSPNPLGGPSIRPNAHSNRQKQLENLRRMEQRIRRLTSGPQGVSQGSSSSSSVLGDGVSAAAASEADGFGPPRQSLTAPPLPEQSSASNQNMSHSDPIQVMRSRMKLNTLDISEAIEKHHVKWTSFEDTALGLAPEETIFYTLVEGRGELILFGGMLGGSGMSPMTGNSQTVTNKVWFLNSKSKML